MSDVVVFFRENLKLLLEVGAGPETGAMLSGIGTDAIMRYIIKAYNKYRENKQKRA